jgi:YgiT-type zinc finger domain-containing protein
MECFFCKGVMKKSCSSYVVNRNGYHLVLDEVPAYVCDQCGEPYFEPEGVDLVQNMIRDLDKAAESLKESA